MARIDLDAVEDDALVESAPDNVEEEESWKHPRSNIFRIMATFWAFIVIGLNGGCYGVLIPRIQSYYSLSYTSISLIFLPNLCGVLAASASNKLIHHAYGQRGIAIIGPSAQMIAWSIVSCHPRYPIVIVCIALASFGSSLQDGGWNAWIGNMKNATETLGVLHGIFGVGAVLAPTIATLMLIQANLSWYTYYYVLASSAAFSLVVSTIAFWHADGATYRANLEKSMFPSDSAPTTDTRESSTLYSLFSHPYRGSVVRNTALFIICYVGIETALAGWIVTFMLRVRHAEPVIAGLTATGFWLGLAFGRIILGFISPRIGEKTAVAGYLVATMLLELVFWLVPNFIVCSICVVLQGFFLGPMFPSGIFVFTKLLPRSLHITGITILCSCGALGGFIFPFVVGSLAETAGLTVLQPTCMALIVAMLFFWLRLPNPKTETGEEEPLLKNSGQGHERANE